MSAESQHTHQLNDGMFQALLEHTDDGVILANTDGRTVYANQPAATLLGCKNPASLKRLSPKLYRVLELRDFYSNEVIPPERWPVQRLLQSKIPLCTEAHTCRTDTSYAEPRVLRYETKWLQQKGQKTLVMVAIRDITRRKQAEASLSGAQKRHAFLLKLSDTLRPLADPLEIQGAACRLLGEHLGAERMYYVEIDEAANEARVGQDYVRGGSFSLVGTHNVSDFGWIIPPMRRGETIVLEDAATSELVPDIDRAAMAAMQIAACLDIPLVKGGVLAGALCATEPKPRVWTQADIELMRQTAERVWDAIERARAEKEYEKTLRRSGYLERERDELAALNESKDEFISLASHQLRTPATGTKQYLGMMLDGLFGELDEQNASMAAKAYESNEQQLKTIDALLKVARLEAGKIRPKREMCNIGDLLREVADEYTIMLEGYKQIIRLSGFTETVQIEADPMLLGNLIDNASKYSPPGTVVTIKVRSTDNALHVGVQDEGPGIAAKDQPRLFQKFSRLDNAATHHVNGTGVGLYWAKKVAELHGGTLEYTSRHGNGSTFTVTLPQS